MIKHCIHTVHFVSFPEKTGLNLNFLRYSFDRKLDQEAALRQVTCAHATLNRVRKNAL